VRQWCSKYSGWLATGFGVVALVLPVIVWAQADMLYDKGSRLVMGTVPEWMAGFGTAFTAFAAVAAFLTFRVAARQWEVDQIERRDQVANQARLIVVEEVPPAEAVPPANEAPRRPDMKPEYRYVLIRNHSKEPVYNIRIPHESPRQKTPHAPMTVLQVVSQEDASGSFRSSTPTIIHRASPELVPVLAPGQATFQLHLPQVPRTEQVTEYVFFKFTDARGAQWERLGSEQPVPVLGEGH
jgi:hypothetical protein